MLRSIIGLKIVYQKCRKNCWCPLGKEAYYILKMCFRERRWHVNIGEHDDRLHFHWIFFSIEIAFSKGQADFKTENVSTISILKDFITKEATKKRVKLEITNSKLTEYTIPSKYFWLYLMHYVLF